jgi:hypothetical protein
MAGASSWNCPICLRRVPERVSECYCGRKRQPEDGLEAPEQKGGRGALPLAAVLAACAAAAYLTLRRPPAPAPTPLTTAAESPASGPRAGFPGERPPRPAPTPALAESGTAASAPPATSEPAPFATKPMPTPADSVDAQRERGAAAYEAAMKNLAGRLVALRGQVQRYDEQCPSGGGLQMGPSGATQVRGCDAPREQIGRALGELRAALDEAEEAARRAWLDPGVQRAIRERSGLDDVSLGETLAAATAATRR